MSICKYGKYGISQSDGDIWSPDISDTHLRYRDIRETYFQIPLTVGFQSDIKTK